jgi:hypothetical protein
MDPSAGGWNVHLMTIGEAINNRTSYYSNLAAEEDGATNRITSSSPSAGYSLVSTILISAALLFIIVGTVVGNILVCTAVCLVRRL